MKIERDYNATVGKNGDKVWKLIGDSLHSNGHFTGKIHIHHQLNFTIREEIRKVHEFRINLKPD